MLLNIDGQVVPVKTVSRLSGLSVDILKKLTHEESSEWRTIAKLARLVVWKDWKNFAEQGELGVIDSARLYPNRYNNGNVDLPLWVLKRVKSVSFQTLLRWDGEIREAKGEAKPMRCDSLIESVPHLKVFVDAFPENATAASIYREAILKFGNAAPSEATIRRYLKRVRSGC